MGRLLTHAVRGDAEGLITELTELWAGSADDAEQHRLLGELPPYGDANREGIENYLGHGPQGSGAIEKTIEVAVGRRLKAKGTSWYRPPPAQPPDPQTGPHLDPLRAGPPLPNLPPRRPRRLMPESGMHPGSRGGAAWGVPRVSHFPRSHTRAARGGHVPGRGARQGAAPSER